MYVREVDHVRAMRLLETAAGSRTRREFAAGVVPALGQLLHADEVSHSEVFTTVGHIGFTLAHPTPTAAQPEAFHAFRLRPGDHPWVAHVTRSGDLRSVRLSELASQQELRRSAFYRDFFRPRGIAFADYQALSVRDGRVVGFAVSRRARDFTTDEHDLFEHLRRPLSRIWDLVARLDTDGGPSAPAPPAELTPAERRVSRLVVQGLPTKEIAGTLGVSAKAVEQHLTNIYRKTNVRSRAAYIARSRTRM